MPMEDPPLPAFNATGEEPMSYALLPQNKGYFYTHVAFMVIAFWILMPMGKNSKNKKRRGVLFDTNSSLVFI
jgi:hypothetical protein